MDRDKEDINIDLLKGKVALISGGSRGLGYGIAQAFLREGAAVVIASRSLDSVDKALSELRLEGDRVAGTTCDVGILEQVEALAEFALEQFGKIDVWVNNAGISCPTGPTVHLPTEMVHALVQTNILGVYHGSIIAMRHFLPQNSGKLINMIGKGERKPVPLHNAYSSSRAWVRNFTLAMAQEYKTTGVGVFLLNPGLVSTDMLQHVHFIAGYEHNLKILRVVQRLLANPPKIPARKAVWLASGATDGKTGLYTSAIGPSMMLKGLGKELGRKVRRQEAPPYNPKVTLVEPAIDLKLADNVALRNKREAKESYLISLTGKRLPEKIGNKAANLQRLMSKKFLVPDTFVLSWDAYLDYMKNGKAVLEMIQSELRKRLDSQQQYAVRSSADVEDTPDHSFAGQFKTILNVQGTDRLLESLQEVWQVAGVESVRSYLQKTQQDADDLRMAVIIQKMVQPVASGVSFSVNPITSLDEVVVETVLGSGEKLVQEGVTPMRWVNKWGNWIEKPEQEAVALEVIQKVVEETRVISAVFKLNVDLEWVYDGTDIYWVQMRDITAVKKADIYSNKMAKEMTPGLVKPLDWSVIVPIKSKMWINVIADVTGDRDIDPDNLAKLFNYRAYHNLGVFGQIFESLGMPRESLEIMMGVAPPDAGKPPFRPSLKFIRLTPRIIRFLREKWVYAQKAENDFPLLQVEAKRYSLNPSVELDKTQLVEKIDRMTDLNLRTTTHTFHAILLMQIYSKILTSLLKKSGVDFAQFDLGAGLQELKDYDPNTNLAALNQHYRRLEDPIQVEIARSGYRALQELDGIEDFRAEFDAFLDGFGHMSDRTGVFDTIPWRETPELILDLIINFEEPKENVQQKVKFEEVQRSGMRSWMLELFYNRARQFYLLREKYSSLYTYTLMLFRVYYMALGNRMLAEGVLNSPEDVYFLYDQEIRDYVQGANSGDEFTSLVQVRKDEMESCRDAISPEIIFGNTPPPVVVQPALKLIGTPTSRGYYTGKTKIIRGISDFHKLDQGDVLVIPYSDVGWIPLFTKAGAVVAESGGMLSHSSIVAREYGIPAVVSVSGVLQLEDNMVVSIDGYKGEIFVHRQE